MSFLSSLFGSKSRPARTAQGKTSGNIPAQLPKGGLLSTYGGPAAAVQYRVWVKTSDGKEFYHADPEFIGIMKAWRRFQQDLEYYTQIALPTGVVYDKALPGYREVDLDTMTGWLKRENQNIWAEIAQKQEEAGQVARARFLEAEKKRLLKESEEIEAEGKVVEAEGPKGSKKIKAEVPKIEAPAEESAPVVKKARKKKPLPENTKFKPPVDLPKENPVPGHIKPTLPPRHEDLYVPYFNPLTLPIQLRFRRGQTPLVPRRQSLAEIVPLNSGAAEQLQKIIAQGIYRWWGQRMAGPEIWKYSLVLDLSNMDALVDLLESQGFIFKTHYAQKAGEPDYIVYEVKDWRQGNPRLPYELSGRTGRTRR